MVHAHQLGHAADPHRIGLGDVHQLGHVEVGLLLQVEALHAALNERRAGKARGLQTRYPDAGARNATPPPFASFLPA